MCFLTKNMVGVARFELSEADLEGVEKQTLKKSATMSHTQKSNLAPSADSLRKQLNEADAKRRELVLSLFLQYTEDTTPILEILFSAASAETLARVESKLLEGGAS